MKIFILLIITLFLISCNSIYYNEELDGITHVKIKTYENYYEQTPISEALINNPIEIKNIKKMLKWLPSKGVVFKDFHDFNESKIIVEIYSGDWFLELRIIDGRLEVQENMYYKKLIRRERKFISYIGSI